MVQRLWMFIVAAVLNWQVMHTEYVLKPEVKFEMRLVVENSDLKMPSYDDPEKTYFLDSKVWVDSSDVASVKITSDDGSKNLLFNLNDVGKAKFADVTKNNIQKKLAIIINEKVYSDPSIMEEIAGGQVMLTFGYLNDVANIDWFLKECLTPKGNSK